ncbi:hypothetical protein [Azospirillum palustre]
MSQFSSHDITTMPTRTRPDTVQPFMKAAHRMLFAPSTVGSLESSDIGGCRR